jgi:hypothetical protein
MNTRFKVFASYNILHYLCDFIHVLIFVTVSKCRKSPKLTNIVIQDFKKITGHFRGICMIYFILIKKSRKTTTCNRLDLKNTTILIDYDQYSPRTVIPDMTFPGCVRLLPFPDVKIRHYSHILMFVFANPHIRSQHEIFSSPAYGHPVRPTSFVKLPMKKSNYVFTRILSCCGSMKKIIKLSRFKARTNHEQASQETWVVALDFLRGCPLPTFAPRATSMASARACH